MLKPAKTGDASKLRWNLRVKQIATFIAVLLSSAMAAMIQWNTHSAIKTDLIHLGKI